MQEAKMINIKDPTTNALFRLFEERRVEKDISMTKLSKMCGQQPTWYSTLLHSGCKIGFSDVVKVAKNLSFGIKLVNSG